MAKEKPYYGDSSSSLLSFDSASGTAHISWNNSSSSLSYDPARLDACKKHKGKCTKCHLKLKCITKGYKPI